MQNRTRSFRASPATHTPALIEPVEPRLLFAAGDLDPSFGAGGVAVAYEVPGSGGLTTFDIKATSDRIYVAVSGSSLLVSVVDTAGRPDPSWAGDGTLATGLAPVEQARSAPGDLVIQPDGKLLVLGKAGPDGATTVARYNEDGTPDATFGGGDGRAEVPGYGIGMALAPGGKIVVGGYGGDRTFGVTRLNPDGSADRSLGGDGTVELDYADGTRLHTPFDVAVHPDDGRIVIVGTVGNVPDDGVVIRINPDGSYDTTFDGDGRLRRDGGHVDDEITAVTALPNGELYIAPLTGETISFPVRLNADGSDDPTFNAVPYDYFFSRIRDIHVLPDGKVLVTGDSPDHESPDPPTFMHRYNPDGTIDATFGGYRFHRPIGGRSDVDPQGRIVVAAPDLVGDFADGSQVLVARYLTTGGTATTVIQAEHGQLDGAQVRRDHSGYTGTGYVDFINDAGDSASWNVQVHSSGTHALTFRYANGSNQRRVMRLTVGGVLFSPRHVWFNPTGSWNTWRTVTIHVPMRSGGPLPRHTAFNRVGLQTIGRNGPNLDSLTVHRPTPTPPVPSEVQAEDGRLEGSAFVSTSNAGYTGRGYVDFTRATGDAVEWVLDSSDARPARLAITYANGSASTRSLRLTVNGQVVSDNLSFAPTGSWSNWWGRTVIVPLRFGDNTIRLETSGVDGPNIDRISLEPGTFVPPE